MSYTYIHIKGDIMKKTKKIEFYEAELINRWLNMGDL
jgi:hypothetical protein